MTRRNFRGDRGRCQTWVRGSRGEPTQDWTFRGLSRFTGETRGRCARRYLPALELQRGLCRPQASGAPGNRLTSCHERGEGEAWGDPGTCFQSRVVIRSGDTPASLLRAPAP